MPLPDLIVLDPHWDAIRTEPTIVFLDNIYGSHRRLRNQTAASIELLYTLSFPTLTSDVFSDLIKKYSAEEVEIAYSTAELLFSEGIVRDYLELRRPDLVDDKTYQRFANEIMWLAGIAGSPELGHLAFSKIRKAKVCVIGLGGAGSLLAQMLAASGVGNLVLVDGDVVQDSNLSRQILYSERSARDSELKVSSMMNQLRELTTFTEVLAENLFIKDRIDAANVVKGCDVVVLTADSPRITIQREVNSCCVELGIPLIYSLVGQIGPFYIPKVSACFLCLERKWRKQSGAEHDQIVAGFTGIPRREIPATVLASASIANALCTEVLAFLTEIIEVSTINKIVRFGANHQTTEEVCNADSDCTCYASRFRRRP